MRPSRILGPIYLWGMTSKQHPTYTPAYPTGKRHVAAARLPAGILLRHRLYRASVSLGKA